MAKTKTMRAIAQEECTKAYYELLKANQARHREVEKAWDRVEEQFNDGSYHKAREIAKEMGLTVGEVAANFTHFRDRDSAYGRHTVVSKERVRRFAEIDDNGNLTGVVITRKDSLVWKIGNKEAEMGEAGKLLEKARSGR